MFGVYELFETSSRCFPEKTAVVYENASCTYGELSERVRSLAAGLSRAGVEKGSNVCLLYRNSATLLCLYFALMRLGAVISPLNWRETAETAARLSELVDGEYLVCSDELAAAGAALAALNPRLATVGESRPVLPGGACLASAGAGAACPEKAAVSPEDTAINIFTGGTTGRPKAASHSCEGLLCQLLSCYMSEKAIRSDDVFLSYAPMFHIGGFTAAMQTLCIGGTLILGSSFDPELILATIREKGVTQMSLIPPSLCADFAKCKGFCPDSLSSVRMVRVSGGSCTEENIGEIFRLFPNASVVNGYGMSERAVNLLNIIERSNRVHDDRGNISVGRPSPLCECLLADGQGGRVTEPGIIGELYGRSPCMMKGYYGAEGSFTEGGWFATGDMFYFDREGNYYFVDRKKDMIKSGGENVYSGEVERVLRSHPAVLECAVVGMPDGRLGELVSAAIVLRPGMSASGRELADYCGGRLAGFKKPRRFLFMDELPRSKVGKISKKAVKAAFAREDRDG